MSRAWINRRSGPSQCQRNGVPGRGKIAVAKALVSQHAWNVWGAARRTMWWKGSEQKEYNSSYSLQNPLSAPLACACKRYPKSVHFTPPPVLLPEFKPTSSLTWTSLVAFTLTHPLPSILHIIAKGILPQQMGFFSHKTCEPRAI